MKPNTGSLKRSITLVNLQLHRSQEKKRRHTLPLSWNKTLNHKKGEHYEKLYENKSDNLDETNSSKDTNYQN